MNTGRLGKGGRVSLRGGALCTLFAFLLLLTVPAITHAQAYYGTITGNVTDPTGAAIVGAKIVATSTATNATFTATSSSIGAYSLAQIPIGAYTVVVTSPSFKDFHVDGVEVHVSTPTQVNATLTPGAATQTVTVQADQVQVDTTSASVGEIVSGSQVRELPLNGENFVGLTQLSPGVSPAASFDGEDKASKAASTSPSTATPTPTTCSSSTASTTTTSAPTAPSSSTRPLTPLPSSR